MLRSTIIVLALLALPAGMLYPLWQSPTAAGEDAVVFFYPLRVLVAGELKAGHLPLWNPFSATGTPLMADPQSAVFFPPNWLFCVLPAKLAYSLCLFLAFGCAGVGAFAYLRRLGLVTPAAVFGAVAFEFCGFMVGHRVHLGVIQTAAMLPWALCGVEMLRGKTKETRHTTDRGQACPPYEKTDTQLIADRGVPCLHAYSRASTNSARPEALEGRGGMLRGSMRGVAMLAAALALALAAGHWPTVIQMSLAVAAYLLVRVRPITRPIPSAAAALVLAGLLMASQIYTTGVGVQSTFRAGLTYSVATENSFFPFAAVLALFPFLLGNRTPNFFAQPWWGPWHQCEMFGYVGLATLILAAAAVAALYRRRAMRPLDRGMDVSSMRPTGVSPVVAGPVQGRDVPATHGPVAHATEEADRLRPLVRLWVWLAAGAFVWMLGGYLPTYRLVYLLPVLGKVRCPARMVLVLDMALASLAAVGVHWWLVRHDEAFRRTLSKACIALTGVMCVLTLGLLVAARAGWLEPLAPLLNSPGPVVRSVWTAMDIKGPSFYVPMATLLASVAAIGWALGPRPRAGARGSDHGQDARATLQQHGQDARGTHGRDAHATHGSADEAPATHVAQPLGGEIAVEPPSAVRRIWILLPVLLADLFIPCRFLDVPPADKRIDPAVSPAANWLAQNGPKEPYRVWGLSRDYHYRPAELLLPNTSAIFGIESISYYGPLQPLEHARLLGFKPWGENYFWPWLLRDNRLISLFNVRYILAADPISREVIESVRVGDAHLQTAQVWHPTTERASQPQSEPAAIIDIPFAQLQAASSFHADERSQNVTLHPGTVYRISLDARAEGGADNMVVAGWFTANEPWWQESPWRLRLDSEQLSERWRHFEWTFTSLAAEPGRFVLATTSTRPVELRNVTLRPAQWEQPAYRPDFPLKPGDAVYVDRTPQGLPALHASDAPVHIYENLLAQPRQWTPGHVTVEPDQEAVLERLRWDRTLDLRSEALAQRPASGPFRSEAAAPNNLVCGPTAARADLLGELIERDEPRQTPPLIAALLWIQACAVILLLSLAFWPSRRIS